MNFFNLSSVNPFTLNAQYYARLPARAGTDVRAGRDGGQGCRSRTGLVRGKRSIEIYPQVEHPQDSVKTLRDFVNL